MKLEGFGLFVNNMEKMVTFYKDVLGFEIKWEKSEPNVYLIKDGVLFMLYGRNDFEKMTKRRYNYPAGLNGTFELSLNVDCYADVDREHKRLASLGVTTLLAPETQSWGQRTCYFSDPEGNLIEISSFNES